MKSYRWINSVIVGLTATAAAPFQVQLPGFDGVNNGHWLVGTSGLGTTIFNDSRGLSLPNLLGESNFGDPAQSRLQRIASDYTSEATIAASHFQYQWASAYSLSLHAFAGGFDSVGPSTFKLQFLGNSTPGEGVPGSTLLVSRTFLATTNGAIVAPDGITHWDSYTLNFHTALAPSAVGQYINIQITTLNSEPGHDRGFPNFDNVSLSVVPEPSAMLLLAPVA